ncbi:nitrate ABC transporter substrate-binding protein [Microbacterium flavum]|uniref:Nitrate ABC transporter substrate-binding protein n=1 Tax=Microbacterium flavum TaxID=415216 RepID=A0ABS5XSB1_9MICO|nr:nitrate ABC transporter substrate-binding protein [Microbacterium flavum]MBT8797402.1 nitrate ABC transporter substrate-binding protein [Microbacterium flavum]
MTRRLAALAPLALAALLLAGCSGGAAPDPTATVGTGAPTTAPPVAGTDPTSSPDATAPGVTCDALVIPDLHAELVEKGWSFKETPFAVAGVTLDDGIECTWADFAKPSGALLLFGWASLTGDQATTIQRSLEQQGWKRESDGENVFLTQDASQAPTVDENGYGMTYEFGDGWITLSDTKQNLLLIQRPLR